MLRVELSKAAVFVGTVAVRGWKYSRFVIVTKNFLIEPILVFLDEKLVDHTIF